MKNNGSVFQVRLRLRNQSRNELQNEQWNETRSAVRRPKSTAPKCAAALPRESPDQRLPVDTAGPSAGAWNVNGFARSARRLTKASERSFGHGGLTRAAAAQQSRPLLTPRPPPHVSDQSGVYQGVTSIQPHDGDNTLNTSNIVLIIRPGLAILVLTSDPTPWFAK